MNVALLGLVSVMTTSFQKKDILSLIHSCVQFYKTLHFSTVYIDVVDVLILRNSKLRKERGLF